MRTKQKEKKASGFFGHLVQIVLVVILVVAVLIIGSYITANGLIREASSESDTVEIGFEDIGKLVTQSAYCKEVNTTDSAKSLFGFTLPLTQSTYIYSYGVEIQAGYDFSAITWSLEDTTIKVTLPEPEVINCEIDLDSFQIYYEKESVFNDISLEENNEALQQLKASAQESAIADGLMDNARTNAETILTAFFGNVYDLDEYELDFGD